MQQEIQQFWELVKTSKKILLINHIRMDGDAWGSLWGLYLVLESMGKQVKAINDCPVPPALQFLWNNHFIEPELNIAEFNPDIIISLDASDTGRLGESYVKWESEFQKRTLVVIDHHISNPLFWDINIVDAKASSVCELLTHVIFEVKLEKYFSPEAATFLYCGLQTDSNMYFNTNTRAETLEAGAKLLRLWADFRLPIMELYKKRTQNQLKLWSHAFEGLEYHCNNSVCACILSREWLRKLWISREELWWYFKWLISEILINIEWIKIAYLIYPLDESENKVSMRSQEWYDVAKICESFWGGGHRQAAGFQSMESKEIISKGLLEKIKEVL